MVSLGLFIPTIKSYYNQINNLNKQIDQIKQSKVNSVSETYDKFIQLQKQNSKNVKAVLQKKVPVQGRICKQSNPLLTQTNSFNNNYLSVSKFYENLEKKYFFKRTIKKLCFATASYVTSIQSNDFKSKDINLLWSRRKKKQECQFNNNLDTFLVDNNCHLQQKSNICQSCAVTFNNKTQISDQCYNYFTCDSGFDNKFSRIQRLRLFFHKIILRLLKPIRLDEVYRVFFSGVNIGFHSDIKGIKYNTAVILLGDIMIDKEYCCMIMKNIKKIFHSESDLIKYFYKAKWICCLKYLPLILIQLVILYFSGRSLFKTLFLNKVIKQKGKASYKVQNELTLENCKTNDQVLCLICMTEPRCKIINPCKHLCLCRQCKLQQQVCPVCKVQITGYTQIYNC